MSRALLDVRGLRKYFPIRKGIFRRIAGHVKAVDGISFTVNDRETFGLVGESGCGKSTTARTILRLVEPSDGAILFDGRDVAKLDGQELRGLRKEMQIIFQDPYTALHPRKRVKDIIGAPLKIHTNLSEGERIQRVKEAMENVGLTYEHMYRYPHEFSGGQRQRIMIARALILNPRFLVLDEPTSALDVSVQARILNLLTSLQKKLELTYLLISHHLSVVEYMSDRIAVMYLGKIVEIAPKDEIFDEPLHPYTISLLSAIPEADPRTREKKRIILAGEIPSPANPPKGCRFHTRCPIAKPVCGVDEPELREIRKGHFVACHFVDESIALREQISMLKK